MPLGSSMNDDGKQLSLFKFSQRHQAFIAQQITSIAGERNQERHIKFSYVIRSLVCLQRVSTRFRRTSINTFNEREYIALLYT
jgi:hypothetical protein